MAQSEIQLQTQSFLWLWNTYPATRRLFFHVPNGGTRNIREASQLKASGVVAGVPDCVFMWQGKGYGFEFKTEAGTLSPIQKVVHAAWAGHADVFVIRTFEEFKLIIEKIVI